MRRILRPELFERRFFPPADLAFLTELFLLGYDGLIGYYLGSAIPETCMHYLDGLDFVVTAMFVAIFMDDFLKHPHDHGSAALGLCATAVCLALFGAGNFIVPSMLAILAVLYIIYRRGGLGTK